MTTTWLAPLASAVEPTLRDATLAKQIRPFLGWLYAIRGRMTRGASSPASPHCSDLHRSGGGIGV
jgi:hypothetical protein